MAKGLTVGGLFSGIGGWELGLERAGMEIAWHCEADPFCRRVLEKHWPGVPCYEDVCQLTGASVRPVDVLCGGFPCQDISLAGKGAGIDGARSGLWSEYARLIGELRPRYVLVENVAALLGRGLDRVLGDLSALGFDAEWDCIPASAVGAPHRRDRVWIVAYPVCDSVREQSGRRDGSGGSGAGVLADDGAQGLVADPAGINESDESREPDARRSLERTEPRTGSGDKRRDRAARSRDVGRTEVACGTGDVADAANERHERSRQARDGRHGPSHGSSGSGVPDTHSEQYEGPPHAFGWQGSAELWGAWAVEPDVGRVAHGVPARVDRLRSLGNALVPQIAQWIGERIVAYEAGVPTT